jgi:pimeloyl-ACP methyl ester carboxylesterase
MNQNVPLDIYLVIGLTKESRHWSADFLDQLKKELNPAAIHLVDLPGAGKFHSHKSPRTVAEIVDEARSHQAFHPERRRLIVAISLGGMVAWEWVSRYPKDFDGMVMINSSLAGVSSTFKRVQPKAILDFFCIAATPKGGRKEKLILDLCSNHQENAQKIHPVWTKLSLEANMRFPNVLSQLIAGMRFRPKQVPSIPMLVVAARHDRLAHYSCSEKIAQISKARFVLCEDKNVGHAFHLDGPEFLVREIKEWLKSTSF